MNSEHKAERDAQNCFTLVIRVSRFDKRKSAHRSKFEPCKLLLFGLIIKAIISSLVDRELSVYNRSRARRKLTKTSTNVAATFDSITLHTKLKSANCKNDEDEANFKLELQSLPLLTLHHIYKNDCLETTIFP